MNPRGDAFSSETLLRALDGFPLGVLIANAERKIVFSNRAFSRMTGYSAAEIRGRDCKFLQGPQTSSRTVSALRSRLERGKRFRGEILNYRKSGESFWNDLTILPLATENGVFGFFGIQHDVSARRKAEGDLRSATARHAFLIDHMLAGVVTHAPDTTITYANATARQLLELTEAEIIGLPGTDDRWGFVAESHAPMPVADYPVNRVAASGEAVKHLLLGRRAQRDGGLVWLMCNAYPALDGAGRVAEIIVSFTDVTDLKRAEEAVASSEERLRLVLQSSPDAPWDYNMITGDAYYSPQWWRMMGFRPDELPSTGALWRERIHPGDLPRVERSFYEAIRGQANTYELEFRIQRQGGDYIPILARGFILRDASGRPMRVSGTNTDLTERKAAAEKITQLAYYDALTGLPNRTLLLSLLQDALRDSRSTGEAGILLVVDLDNFKAINDSLGFGQGDALLKEVARRLAGAAAGSAVVARLGSDTFAFLTPTLRAARPEAAARAQDEVEAVKRLLAEPYVLDGIRYVRTTSIGAAVFDQLSGDAEETLRQAELARHAAKAAGRARSVFFEPSLQDAVDRRLQLERDLRAGLEAEELILHYQPQVDASRRLVGAEALVRWRRGSQGLVSPAEFVPLAEATGLIQPLGRWVLQSACATLREWEGDPTLAGLTLSVNISAKQLQVPDFADQLIATLRRTGADPSKLILELTESCLVEDAERTVEKMARLRQHGIRFSLDDFGTGYSSLAYLKRLPLHQLKIDKGFVRDAPRERRDAAVALIILSLAEKLGLTVVAEGVESQEQFVFLAENGCRFFQGYYFGRPSSIEDFERLAR